MTLLKVDRLSIAFGTPTTKPTLCDGRRFPPTNTQGKRLLGKHIASIILLASLTASAQISTTCTTIGNHTFCNTTDAQQQQQNGLSDAIQSAQDIITILGAMGQQGAIRKRYFSLIRKQCQANGAGSTWTVYWSDGKVDSGICLQSDALVEVKKHK